VNVIEQWHRETRRWGLIVGVGVLALVAVLIGLWASALNSEFSSGPEYVESPQVPPR
jgi:hypothetical protein